MAEEDAEQTDWRDEVGLSDETAYVVLYPSKEHANEWNE
jgi:hypothetical protein